MFQKHFQAQTYVSYEENARRMCYCCGNHCVKDDHGRLQLASDRKHPICCWQCNTKHPSAGFVTQRWSIYYTTVHFLSYFSFYFRIVSRLCENLNTWTCSDVMMYLISIKSRLKDVNYTASYKYLLAFLFYTSSFISIYNVHNVIAPTILIVGCRPLRLLIQNISIFGLKLYRNLYHYRNCFKRHSVGKISSPLQDPCVMYCP